MGKANRLKVERALVRAASVGRTPVEALHEATRIVGNLFGETPDCADAAALLHMIAANLGYHLTPRPVALLASDARSGTMIVMGPAARATIAAGHLNDVEDRLPGGKDTGHLILTSEDPMMLFDPNLRQLGSHGISVPSVMMNISNLNDSTNWRFDQNGLHVQYILDEENHALLPRYERAQGRRRSEAGRIAFALRTGKTASTLTL